MEAPEAEDRGGLSWLGALILLGLAALVGVGVGFFAVGLRALAEGSSLGAAVPLVLADPLMLGLLQTAALGVATYVGLRLTLPEEPLLPALDLRPVPSSMLMLALTAGFALQFPLHELASGVAELVPRWMPGEEEQEAMQRMLAVEGWADGFRVVLGVALLPALSEELFFRGLLLPALSKRHGVGQGLLLSSLLFGLVHLNPLALIYASVAGLILGALRLRAGSIAPGIALHTAFNLIPVALSPELIRIRGFNTVSETIEHLPLGLLIGASLVAVLCLWGIARLADLEAEGGDEH